MESSSSSSPSASSDDPLVSQVPEKDPLALPSENSNHQLFTNDNDISFKHPEQQQQNAEQQPQQQQQNSCGDVSSNSDKENSNNEHEYIEQQQQQQSSNLDQQQPHLSDPLETNSNNSTSNPYQESNLMSHQLAQQQQQQYDNENPEHNSNMLQQHPPPQQQIQEQHKTFSHSIENLSKTSSSDIKIFPNLIDAHDQYDDGYETGVSDLLSNNKYKLPSLPPPSSSPYSSLSSSSMSTISTATATPTSNLLNPSQQQSPSYMAGGSSMPPHMNQYQNQTNQQQQQQPQHQFPPQNHQQYPPLQHPSHQSTFNYHHHHMFNRMQSQSQQQQQPPLPPQQQQQQQQQHTIVPKTELPSSDDPYRFVEDEMGSSMANMPSQHPNSMQQQPPMHQHHGPHHMAPNYNSAASSPMPMGPGGHMNHNQMNMAGSPQTGNPMNPMMQYNEQHMSHHHHMMHHQQQQNPQSHMNPHMMNGISNNSMQHGLQNHAPNNTIMPDMPKKRGRKKKLRDENGNPIEDRPPKERKKHDRFNGMPEEEVTKRTLPDHLIPNLDIIIVGINPGLFAAYKGHHYAGPGNHFWKCLYLSGLTSVQMTAEEDYKLLQYGIGFTNMVQRPTKGSADLTRKEIKEGSRILLDKIRKYQPKVAVFNGKLIYEVFSGKKDFCFGKQPETVEGTNTYMWVMPSSSARCAQLPRAADKVPFYAALKKFRDYLNGLVPEYDESEYVFNDPKYNTISTEAELKAEAAFGFTAIEGDTNVLMTDPLKKKRGRPKKIRGENGEEIVQPRRPPPQLDPMEELDPTKKKRGRPKKNKDLAGGAPSTPKQKRNNSNINSNSSNSNIANQTNLEQMQMQQQQSNFSHQLPPQGPPSSQPPTPQQQQTQPQQQQQQQHSSLILNNGNHHIRPPTGSVQSFLSPMNSPSPQQQQQQQQNYGLVNGANNGILPNSMLGHSQMNPHQVGMQQNASPPMNLCYPPPNPQQNHQIPPDSIQQPPSQQTYQQSQHSQGSPTEQSPYGHHQQSSDLSSEISAAISSEQMVGTSPNATSPSNQRMVQQDYESPSNSAMVSNNSEHQSNTNDLNYTSQTPTQQSQSNPNSIESQQQQSPPQATLPPPHESPNGQQPSPGFNLYSQLPHLSNQNNPNSNYVAYHQRHPGLHGQQPAQQPPQQQQQMPQHYTIQHQQPINNVNKGMLHNNSPPSSVPPTTAQNSQNPNPDAYKDVTTKSLSGLESLVDQIPAINENDALLGSSSSNNSNNNSNAAIAAPASILASTASTVASSIAPSSVTTSSASLLPSLPPPHHPHYPYSTASQPPYSANPFSVSSLTSPSNYSAAMNSYHQNVMGTSHLTSTFMEPPHMPVPITPLYSYQQPAGYSYPPPPPTLHMPSPNYPYYTNLQQAPASGSWFDRIKPDIGYGGF